MDIASLLGIISGISLIVSAIFLGGDIHNFINIPGFMIVIGGTVATTLLTFQFKDVAAAFKAAYFVFSKDKEDPNMAVETMIWRTRQLKGRKTSAVFQSSMPRSKSIGNSEAIATQFCAPYCSRSLLINGALWYKE